VIIKDGQFQKIKVIKDVEQESYFTGEPMSWRAGQYEEAWVGEHLGQTAAEINWG